MLTVCSSTAVHSTRIKHTGILDRGCHYLIHSTSLYIIYFNTGCKIEYRTLLFVRNEILVNHWNKIQKEKGIVLKRLVGVRNPNIAYAMAHIMRLNNIYYIRSFFYVNIKTKTNGITGNLHKLSHSVIFNYSKIVNTF